MGRGRAKAKQAKVARELKYSIQPTDFRALQQELSGGKPDAWQSNEGNLDHESLNEDRYASDSFEDAGHGQIRNGTPHNYSDYGEERYVDDGRDDERR